MSSATRCTGCSRQSPIPFRGYECVPRFRRVPESGERDVDPTGRRSWTLTRVTSTPASRCPRESSTSFTHLRRSTRASRPASTWPPSGSIRRGTRCTDRGGGRRRCPRIRGIRPRRHRARQSSGADALFVHLLRACVRRRLQCRVLLVHLERGARRRHRRVVPREWRTHSRERRPIPCDGCWASVDRRIRSRPTATSAAATRRSPHCWLVAGSRTERDQRRPASDRANARVRSAMISGTSATAKWPPSSSRSNSRRSR